MKAEQLEKHAKPEDWCNQVRIITFMIRICILPIFLSTYLSYIKEKIKILNY